MIVTFLYLQVLDILSTLLFLNFGVENESNLLGRQFVIHFGVVNGLVILKIITISIAMFIYFWINLLNQKLARKVMVAMVAVYMVAVAWNMVNAYCLYQHCFMMPS